MDPASLLTTDGLAALTEVLLIDLVLAGDNAIVVGALAAGLPAAQRKKVILIGIGAALVLRILFALAVTQLLQVVGLILAGGLLLLWVAYNMYRELKHAHPAPVTADDPDTPVVEGPKRTKTFLQAAIQVTVADLSMSLDNVLAVAATARDHPTVLFIGLALSVTLMGIAANFVARLVQRYRWIAWVGLLMILYVAGRMVYDGIVDEHYGVLHLIIPG